jgi:hypothetical protein
MGKNSRHVWGSISCQPLRLFSPLFYCLRGLNSSPAHSGTIYLSSSVYHVTSSTVYLVRLSLLRSTNVIYFLFF